MSGGSSPRNYGMYNVAEAQFWKQRVARETHALSTSDEVNALVEETKKALQSQKKQQDPARRAVRAKKVEQLTKELIEERSARAKLEAELVDLRQTMTTAGLI